MQQGHAALLIGAAVKVVRITTGEAEDERKTTASDYVGGSLLGVLRASQVSERQTRRGVVKRDR
jgi:hypothetical protein